VALNGATPLYVQLIVHFRQQIASGRWEVGSYIPVLEELMREYGVARATVRQALGFLQREGLIESRHGRGIRVLKQPEATLWFPLPDSWDELVASSDQIQRDVLQLRASSIQPELPESHPGRLASNYHTVRLLLNRAGIPYSISTWHIDRRIIDEVGETSLAKISVYRILDETRREQIAHAMQELTLGTADAEIAHLLQIPLNSAVVSVSRWVFDADGLLIFKSHGEFRSDFVQASRLINDFD
jgi:GntR family transcriptional regulator